MDLRPTIFQVANGTQLQPKGSAIKRRLQTFSYACLAMMAAAWSVPGQAAPDGNAPPAIAVVTGVIKAVDPDNQMFTLSVAVVSTPGTKPQPLNEMKITVDLKTTYSLDGKPTTMDRAMIVGNGAAVTHLGGLALKVHAISKLACSQWLR